MFLGQCAELCGIYHAKMLASVEVLPADEFDAWLEERSTQQAAGTSPLGEELWEGDVREVPRPRRRGRNTGRASQGPGSARTPRPSRSSSARAAATMPPVGRDWTDTEIDAMTDYLEQNLGS